MRSPLSHWRKASLLTLAGWALATTASAQTTHTVNLFSISFSPKQLTIQVGDTVRWVWGGGFHDVVSGNSTPNGIFASALVQDPGFTYELTFDQAFLDANPVPGNDYAYYCSIHLPVGMTGVVRVEIPPTFHNYGCGNPANSLLALAGSASPGGTLTFGVDNPIASQPLGSLAFLVISTAPDANFPCGTTLPGLGMVGPYGPGELLLSIAAPNPVLILGPQVWNGSPAAFPVGIPPAPSFAGLHLYFQGAIAEPTGAFALTEAADVGIGE